MNKTGSIVGITDDCLSVLWKLIKREK